MAALLKLVDEHFGTGETARKPALELRLVSEKVTVRDIISRRVADEVESVNAERLSYAIRHEQTRSFLIPIEKGSVEDQLKPSLFDRIKKRPNQNLLNANKEIKRAIEAFESRSFLLLFDDRQIEDLDYEIPLMPDSEVVFLHLSPLKGG